LQEKALAKAWASIEARLKEMTAAQAGRRFDLIEVSFDPVPGDSVIEELPDQPKSSRPQAVKVAVRLRMVFEVR
jgi:hypothetical protein